VGVRPEALFRTVEPLIQVFAPQGVSYVGDGELARVCKIAHNVMLGVVIENLIEIMLVAEKAGVAAPRLPRLHEQWRDGLDVHAATSRPHWSNLDWTTTFTPELLRRDLDLGPFARYRDGVPMPVNRGGARGAAAAFWRGAAQARSGKISRRRFRRGCSRRCDRRGAQAREREQQVPTGLE